METRVAMISILVEDNESVARLNELLHQYRDYIIARMGVPYSKRGVNLISLALDAPQDEISALSGKLGMLKGVSAKAVFARL